MKFGMSNPRLYWHGGKPVPSVSTVIKIFNNGIPFNWPATRAMDYIKSNMIDPDFSLEDALIDASHDAEAYMDECSAIGTAIHDAIAQYFITGSKEYTIADEPRVVDEFVVKKMMVNVFKWLEKYHVVPILVEKALSCDKYAGTLDLFCEIDSEAIETKRWCTARKLDFPQPHRVYRALLDWKITASYYDDMPVKLSAYKKLLADGGYCPERMIIARFSKDTGSLNIKDYTDEYVDSYKTFDLARQLFDLNFKKYLNETEQEAERQRSAKKERKLNGSNKKV